MEGKGDLRHSFASGSGFLTVSSLFREAGNKERKGISVSIAFSSSFTLWLRPGDECEYLCECVSTYVLWMCVWYMCVYTYVCVMLVCECVACLSVYVCLYVAYVCVEYDACDICVNVYVCVQVGCMCVWCVGCMYSCVFGVCAVWVLMCNVYV